MIRNYLFPHRFKKIGWFFLLIGVPLGFYTIITDFTPPVFDMNVFSLFPDNILTSEKGLFKITTDNILNEILGILVIIGLLFVAFSKERIEDEYISKIRLESLVWAVFFNYAILILSFLVFYGFTFAWVMIFNMFTILVFFIIRFHWKLYRLKKQVS